jgi:hypothetical protein
MKAMGSIYSNILQGERERERERERGRIYSNIFFRGRSKLMLNMWDLKV